MQYLSNHPYLSDIVQIDRGFIIRQSVPPGADNRIDLKLLAESEHAARSTQTTGQPAYADPFVGLQGQQVFAVYVPIVRNGTYLGTFSGIYSID